MAKGNLILGMGRGKIGDIVVTRGAGEQISRARNRNPKNPRTVKQMAQRAALATVVEFFTRGKRNLFKFAFESKRKGESDYNAFVRANIGNVPVQSHKTLLENGPVFGQFILSQGSLPQPKFVFDANSSAGAILCKSLPAAGADLTIGQLSKAIADYNGLQDGDIITIVAIASAGCALTADLEGAILVGGLAEPVSATVWTVKQFTLNFASTAKVSTLDIFDVENVSAGESRVALNSAVFVNMEYGEEYPCCLGVIASRNTASGLKVSTSTMKISEMAENSANIGKSDEWRAWVAQHWSDANTLDVAPVNILEGSLSEN